MALINITYLVADGDLAVQDLLIGLPVLKHLGVDTKLLLEVRRALLDGPYCSTTRAVGNGTHGGQVSRLMIARLNRVLNKSVEAVMNASNDRPHVGYYKARDRQDSFPDPSLLDPIDHDQHEEIESATEKMLEDAKDNGFPEAKYNEL